MNVIITLTILAIIVVLVLALAINRNANSFGLFKPHPYFSKKPLTQTEANFYRRLVEALPDYIVLAQVQLSRFIEIDKTKIMPSETYKWLNPIRFQSVDYLICTKDFSIVAAVELDDKYHLNEFSAKNDEKKNNNLAAAKVPLIRWHAERIPLHEEIKREISKFVPAARMEYNSQAEEGWFNDQQSEFFNRPQKKPNPILVFGLSALIVIGLYFWVTYQFNNNRYLSVFKPVVSDSSRIDPPLYTPKPSHIPVQNQPISLNELIERRRQELAVQQEVQRKQDGIRDRAIKEEKLRDEIWSREFKNKVDCTNRDDIVSCGNDNIANRRRFEAYWEANKSRLLNH